MKTDTIEKARFNVFNLPVQSGVCSTHGEFESINISGDTWSGCPECADDAEKKEHKERQERLKIEYEEREARDRRDEWHSKLKRCGIPERFKERTLDSFIASSDKQRDALEFANDYALNFSKTPGRCAMFVGTPGTGKTHLSVGVGLHLMREGRPVLFCTAIRALRRIKASWGKGAEETEIEAVASLVFPHLLILDEVGVQFGSEAEKILLFDVMNERYESRKSTILISNLTIPEVKEYLGERIFDRMREDGGRFLSFDWESYRGKNA